MPITSGAGERLRNEASFLRKLSSFPQLRPHIPQLLFAGDWNNSTIVFQSPLDGETGPVSFTALYKDFLAALQHCEPTQIRRKVVGAKHRRALGKTCFAPGNEVASARPQRTPNNI